MTDNIYSGLKQLGGGTELPSDPEAAMLERVKNPQADTSFNVCFGAPEFTNHSRTSRFDQSLTPERYLKVGKISMENQDNL